MNSEQDLATYHTIRNLWVRCKASEDDRFVDGTGDCVTLETVIDFRGKSHTLDEWAVILGFAGHVTVTVPGGRKGDVAGYYGYSMSGVTQALARTVATQAADSTTGEPITLTANEANGADTLADGGTPHVSFKSVSGDGPRNRHERRRAEKLGRSRKGNRK